jgi:hypothetical protein
MDMRLRTVRELRKIARKFASGELERIMIVGPPGQGKSESIKAALGRKRYRLFKGRVSAIALYEELYVYQDLPIVLDDTAEMLLDRNAQEILRDLTETTFTRKVSWVTQSKSLDEKGIPKSFLTRSPVCVLANKLGTGGVWPALNSRCLRWHVEFEWAELVAETRRLGWFNDDEILEYALTHARCQPDLRLFEKAAVLRNAKLGDWRQLFEAEKTEPEAAIQSICLDPDLSTEDKVRQFVAGGHGSRATYFRKVKKLGVVSTETGVAS